MRLATFRSLALCLLLSATAAHADTFTLTTASADPFTFTLDDNPTPIDYQDDQYFYATASSDLGDFDLGFATAASDQQLILLGPVSILAFTGPQLFTGPTSSPTLIDLSAGVTLTAQDGTLYTLTSISNSLTPTPEPSSFALLGSGVAALALIARRRATTTVRPTTAN